MPISPESLNSAAQIDFDLYLNINGKLILYVPKGNFITDSQLERLLSMGQGRLYMVAEDFKKYNEQIRGNIDSTVDNKATSVVQKAVAMKGLAREGVGNVHEAFEFLKKMEFEGEGESFEISYQTAMHAAQGLLKLVSENKGVLGELYNEDDGPGGIVEHSVNVCALATRFAFLQGIRGEELESLATAALIHDIGLRSIEKDERRRLFKTPHENLKEEDKESYHFHPIDAVDFIKDLEYVSPLVITLIKKHEEKLQQSGYPEKVQDLTPLEQILSLCNNFDKRVTCYGKTPEEALVEMMTTEIGNYDLEQLKKLKKALLGEGVA